ncbi:MAG: HEAT repeat domain-containing protein [Acidobacteriia bacterium]|nr:HEAT repeat domain-containing protein [Terriglobia bacterium]
MKIPLLLLVPTVIFAADQEAVQRLFDGKLTPAQRATACFELRGKADPEVINALSRAMEDPDLLSCAAGNLQHAGAIEPLKQALASHNFQVRAAAARELGTFQRPELLEALGSAAQDENLLVAVNALSGLSQYRDAAVTPYLTALARKGGMIGDMALDRLGQTDPDIALKVARGLLSSAQVPDLVYAMRIIGASGDSSDLAQLKKIAAANPEILTQRDRGFGFMPAINLSRAAQSAIAAIQSRLK